LIDDLVPVHFERAESGNVAVGSGVADSLGVELLLDVVPDSDLPDAIDVAGARSKPQAVENVRYFLLVGGRLRSWEHRHGDSQEQKSQNNGADRFVFHARNRPRKRLLGLGIFRVVFQTFGEIIDFGLVHNVAIVVHAINLTAHSLFERLLAALRAEGLLVTILEGFSIRPELPIVLVGPA
jgi:hypothetical protein